MKINKKLKAFTLIELLVSMALSGVLVVFAYMGYNQIQHLFFNYTVQSKFISDYNQLNKALYYLSNQAKTIEKNSETSVVFKTDSNLVNLSINDTKILLQFKSHTDTFDLKSEKMQFEYLKINTESVSSILISNFDCEVNFQNQKFRVSFHKDYDAVSVLKTSLALIPINEQY
jgi:prepilin-type N-terminal cleavage/methylation domain-containing protein